MRQMAWAIGFMVLSSVAQAALPVCVRNWKAGGRSPCDKSNSHYTWVYGQEKAAKNVCARVYAHYFCENVPTQYTHIPAKDGTDICTMNHNQGASDLCKSLPAQYQYVLSAVP